MTEPDPGSFAAAEERLLADEYTFVADALDRDVRAAVDAAWRGVYVGDEEPTDVPRIESLSALPDRSTRNRRAATVNCEPGGRKPASTPLRPGEGFYSLLSNPLA